MNRRDNIRTLRLLIEGMEGGKSPAFKKLRRYVTSKHLKDAALNLKNDPSSNVVSFLNKRIPALSASKKENYIRKIAKENTVGEYNGETIDEFSSFMISRVLDRLNDEQKVRLLNRTLPEITAIAYKLASRSEF